MEIILNHKRFFILLLTSLLLISCNDQTVYSHYKSVSNASWQAHKNITFNFQVRDTIAPKNVFINLRNNKEYPFSNLFLITELIFPNGTKIVDTLQYEMADEIGQFLGTGFANIKDNKLFYKENKVFPVSGDYTLHIRHAMRKNNEVQPIPFLKGVLDVGFSIEKIK